MAHEAKEREDDPQDLLEALGSQAVSYRLTDDLFGDGELIESATARNFRIVQNEGSRQVSREVKPSSRSIALCRIACSKATLIGI